MGTRSPMKAKRDAAAAARRIALSLTDESDKARVLAFAAELEAQAFALEAEVRPEVPAKPW